MRVMTESRRPARQPGTAPTDCEARLLVVDDEPTILELLAASLRFAGFDVLTASSGGEALRLAAAARPELILLDVMMPDGDGFEVIRRIRAGGPRIPVIFLTARHSVQERVTGLTLGGDDYIAKPFSLDEVLARIRAVLRRSRGEPGTSARLAVGGLELDEDSHEVWRDGNVVALSPTEFKLLRYLMSNAGRVLSKARILDHVWDYNFRGDGNIVESNISYLRRKVDRGEPRLIHTIRGIGYVLRIPPS
jgi:two-component system OmpR family response regulator